MALLGAEWVLYVLVALSIISVAIMIERARFYRRTTQDLAAFREAVRGQVGGAQFDKALENAEARLRARGPQMADFETPLTITLLDHAHSGKAVAPEVLAELAQDSLLKTKLAWDRGLAVLATIGSNAPFVGLFGTVLGIIQAFHELSQKSGTGVQSVTAGISDALISTAVGILVAIPALIAFNLFQRRVRTAVSEAEALKSFLVGKILAHRG
jgi:biopolymer transport protein ExbB